jgi:hypothetical protein
MGTWNIYIAPIKSDGTYEDYLKINKYCIGKDIGKIKIDSQKNDFDIGIAPTPSFNLRLNNSEGLFSIAGDTNSIFNFRRKGSLVKIAYLFGDTEPICGIAVAGVDVLGPEKKVFEGLLIDKNSNQSIMEDDITFTVLGKESIFDDYEADITSLASTDSIAVAIYNIINNDEVKKIFNVGLSYIVPSINSLLEDINSDTTLAYLENKTIKEVLNILLEMSASVLYTMDNFIFVTDRSSSSSFDYYFYGQASNSGIENIQNISGFKSGNNRMFNYWTWSDTSLIARSSSSITNNGLQKHEELDLDFVTETDARQDLLDEYNTSFSDPKKEFVLSTYININVLALNLFDTVSIDYPNVPIPLGSGIMPIWGSGSMIWRDEITYTSDMLSFSWPGGLFNLEIAPNVPWQITGIEIDTQKDIINYSLREV